MITININGAFVRGRIVKGGFELHLLTIPNLLQGAGVGERVLRELKSEYGNIIVVDPIPSALGFWEKMKKKNIVDVIEYSEGDSDAEFFAAFPMAEDSWMWKQ